MSNRETKYRAVLHFLDGKDVVVEEVGIYPNYVLIFSEDFISHDLIPQEYFWDEDGVYRLDNADCVYRWSVGDDWCCTNDNFTRQQYVGKFSEVEVWEGDVFEPKGIRYTVEWEDDGYYLTTDEFPFGIELANQFRTWADQDVTPTLIGNAAVRDKTSKE